MSRLEDYLYYRFYGYGYYCRLLIIKFARALKWWFTFDDYEVAVLKVLGIALAIYASPFIILIIVSWVMYGNPFL